MYFRMYFRREVEDKTVVVAEEESIEELLWTREAKTKSFWNIYHLFKMKDQVVIY